LQQREPEPPCQPRTRDRPAVPIRRACQAGLLRGAGRQQVQGQGDVAGLAVQAQCSQASTQAASFSTRAAPPS
ncbi:hypothetical protein, partial [Streptomyces sp. NPDC055039]